MKDDGVIKEARISELRNVIDASNNSSAGYFTCDEWEDFILSRIKELEGDKVDE